MKLKYNMQQFENNNPQLLLDEAEKFSNIIFLERKDLLLIFTEGLKFENHESFERLIFTAKYVNGLKRVIEKGANLSDVKNLDDVKKDLSNNLISLVEILKEFNINMPNDEKEMFRKKYLSVSHECLKNINNLLNALELTKIYLNYLKRK